MIKLTWATTALLDLAHIRHYIARFNPAAASSVARKIVDIADLLANHPEMGVRTKREHVRRLVVRGSPYIIYYKLDDAGVEILELFDGRQEIPRSGHPEP